MTAVRTSYLKVPYDLRSAKQIERRMIIDALHTLSCVGFPIRDYKYTGMGSIFFVDFIMFHKLLGIKKMLSIELNEDDKARVEFNRPFNENMVDIKYGQIGKYIADTELDRDLNHILWLDYDVPMKKFVLDDIKSAAAVLSHGSILLITVDVDTERAITEVRPDLDNDDERAKYEDQNLEGRFTPEDRIKLYSERAGELIDPGWKNEKEFVPEKLPTTVSKIILNAIKNGMAGRSEISFQPLFSFLYADGHEMLTFGGMICNNDEKCKINGIDFRDAFYIRRDIDQAPYKIETPILTRKEKLYLDSNMPCADGWEPIFNLKEGWIEAYREIYRFFPSYMETLL